MKIQEYVRAFITLILVLCMNSAHSQKKRARELKNKDTLAMIREFVRVSNIYQQLPLYLDLEISNTTNFITGEADTARLPATFFIQGSNCYMRYGEAEQLVSDSMALIVSDRLQRMILYTDAAPVSKRMQEIIKMLKGDSSLAVLAQRFTASQSKSAHNTASITLMGRGHVYGTTLAKEEIRLEYNSSTGEPIKVITIKRTLLPVSEHDYNALAQRSDLAGMLISPEGKDHFVVKEQQGLFAYKLIRHDPAMQMPVTIADRLIRSETGELIPVKSYEGYSVTYN